MEEEVTLISEKTTKENILSLLDDIYQYAENLDKEEKEFICSRIKTIEGLIKWQKKKEYLM